MFSIKMITFSKTTTCPSSLELLAFQRKEMTAKKTLTVETHLNICEFCQAEVEFYSHYPQADEKIPGVEIPFPLYELARSLMGDRKQDFLTNLFAENKVTT